MFGNLGKIVKLAGEMKTRLPEIKKKLENSTFTAEAGGGVVSATVNGKGLIADVKLDKDLLADTDAEMLEDLIKAAVSAAQDKAAEASKQAMAELTGGMDIPGLNDMLK